MPSVSLPSDDLFLPGAWRVDEDRQRRRVIGTHLEIAPPGHRFADETLRRIDQCHRLGVRLGKQKGVGGGRQNQTAKQSDQLPDRPTEGQSKREGDPVRAEEKESQTERQ